MRCKVCDHKPRQFDLFGGGYWRTLFYADVKEHWVCPGCAWWAYRILGVASTRLKLEG